MKENKALRLAPVIGLDFRASSARMARSSVALKSTGNWESSDFNLPREIREHIPRIGEHETAVVMHNDAVVQGLSEIPRMTSESTGASSPSARSRQRALHEPCASKARSATDLTSHRP